MTEIIRIIDAQGVHPERLNQSVIEERLYKAGRFDPTATNRIFVFESNEAGRHGAGAAKVAHLVHGARMGTSFGPSGRSFAIPTKDPQIRHTLSLYKINEYVKGFLRYAAMNPQLKFQVTCIGCGLAGLKHEQIAPMFYRAPENCLFDTLWEEYLPDRARFWGTFLWL